VTADETMRALTVRQPWAWAIAQGIKTVENRTWTTKYRGLLAIHAGMNFDAAGARSPLVQRAWAARPHRGGQVPRLSADAPGIERGTFVAVAQLVGVHEASGGCCQPWGEHPAEGGLPVYHWQLTGVVALPGLVPADGRQGLWFPTAAQLAALAEAVAR
jgi:hypothetical protein